jgi:hypothetical protein
VYAGGANYAAILGSATSLAKTTSNQISEMRDSVQVRVSGCGILLKQLPVM